MELIVDCVLNPNLLSLQSNSPLSNLLAKGEVTQLDMPLEAVISEQFSLKLVQDYPIAAISALAEDINVGNSFWLRADPVHLLLQRDCFSLAGPVPLLVNEEHSLTIIASLNQHFNQVGLNFCIGKSGAWYLRCNEFVQIQTTLPSVAMGKNVHHFMPQGIDATNWIALLNEVQMLLHQHPVNEEREANGQIAVNSIWLSGGGINVISKPRKNDVDLIIANNIFYQGLAKWSGLPYQSIPENLNEVFLSNYDHVRLQFPELDNLDDVWFCALLSELKRKKINKLILNLGLYERSIKVEIEPLDCYKFWRTPKAVMHYLT